MKSGMRKTLVGGLAMIAGLLTTGCGNNTHQNNRRPPTTVVLSAAITPSRVTLSPTNLGAGPIQLIVTNLTSSSQQVTFESSGSGPGIKQQTGPINPQDTATLKALVKPGAYTVRVTGAGVRPATISFGPERPSGQNDLNLP